MPSRRVLNPRYRVLLSFLCFVVSCQYQGEPSSLLQDALLIQHDQTYFALPVPVPVPTPPPDHKTPAFSDLSTPDKDRLVTSESEQAWTLAIAAARRGDWQACRSASQDLLKLRPYDQAGITLLAVAYRRLGKSLLSDYYTELALELDPASPAALNLKGLALQSRARTLHEFQQAAQYFATAFTSKADELAAGFNLGFLYLDLGHAERAAETFRELKARCAACLGASYGLGIAHNRLGLPGEAAAFLREVIAKEPKHPMARYHLALAYLHQDQRAEARRVLIPLWEEVKGAASPTPSESEFHAKLNALIGQLKI